ncbi:D-arabinose 1-dehydrogenase [Penicillium macrosclerotiorum]|uniref:D-arabinose 1-dehydrogenase n=1 Tax=Penicillium macrosclerotiorum TaxID=303699 RepID=UPI0025472DAC|nr:D-arabinose 1-dehydrogenase [Penicillium macrosclerotiorum]KAJ5683086.1 D-arabinose 1-dehydrogenase [Penicillium macrosclerotiorum]
MPPSTPLSADLPPLIMGTATFNSQYNANPYALPTTELVQRALARGIRAFDTSPYYGPAEELLGRALATDFVQTNFPRDSYRLLTKVGRIASGSFDYSPLWIRHSVRRSLRRLHTSYLDVVYCHDVEFVTPAEVLTAVRELRRLRDEEGLLRYVGISGYPVNVLSDLAELVLRETGEPLDIVMSYANFTLQNTRLRSLALPRLLAAGVDVVPNASPLGMGLLRRDGVPIGSMGDFHPAPNPLRSAIHDAAECATRHGEKLEVIAIRFALESWLRAGAKAGALGAPLARSADADPSFLSVANIGTGRRLGVSVMGVSNLEELDETLRVWHSILDGLENWDEDEDGDDFERQRQSVQASTPQDCPSGAIPTSVPHASTILTPSEGLITDRAWSHTRRAHILQLTKEVRDILGAEWVDYVWASPPEGFKNILSEEHIAAMRKIAAEGDIESAAEVSPPSPLSGDDEAMPTPPLDAERQLA